jgi:hypothetical protein
VRRTQCSVPRSELVERISRRQHHLSIDDVRLAVDVILDAIARRVATGGRVESATLAPSLPGCAARGWGAIHERGNELTCPFAEYHASLQVARCWAGEHKAIQSQWRADESYWSSPMPFAR